jgi:hypothetical protein
MNLLAEWGYPEPGDLGPREQPALLGQAMSLLLQQKREPETLARQAGVPPGILNAVLAAGTNQRGQDSLRSGDPARLG